MLLLLLLLRSVPLLLTVLCCCFFERQSAGKVAIASMLLSPLLLAVAAYSSFFMSPVLPFLGLPIFLPAFPRPRRQWQVVSTSETASSTDAALYKQLVPQLTKSLQWLVQRGVLGEVEPGACFMVRMETLVAAVQVLEVGFGRVVVSIRGLEQQEPTSCHNVEAGILDNVFAQINKDETQLKGWVPVPVLRAARICRALTVSCNAGTTATCPTPYAR